MRVFTIGGAHIYRQDTSKRCLGERFSRGGTISHQQRIHVPTPLSPKMVLSLFWLSIGMAFVSSCLVSRFSSRLSVLLVYFRPRGFFSFYHVELRSARFVRRVVSRRSQSSPGVYVLCNLSTGFRRRIVYLSLDDSNVNRDSATIFCLVDWQRCTQVVILMCERKIERKKKKERKRDNKKNI